MLDMDFQLPLKGEDSFEAVLTFDYLDGQTNTVTYSYTRINE